MSRRMRGPELHAVAERERVGVRRAFVRARKNVQPSENHLRAPSAIPVRQFIGPPRESQMHGDADDLRHRPKWRSSIEKILVPVVNAPMFRRGGGETGQGERWREHVLAEAGIRILGIEGVDQERVVRLDRSAWNAWVEERAQSRVTSTPLPR